ncbi:MAG: hypothetical protein ACI8XM_000245 [Haloarculaceae archaeon]|jgi:hypothetical protein
MAGLQGSAGGGSVDYVQDTAPADPSDSETWVDTNDPARPMHVYSVDRGEWIATYESVPLFVTQEAVSFAESGVSLSQTGTMVSGGSLQLLDGVFASASVSYGDVNSVNNWSGVEFDLATDADDLRAKNNGTNGNDTGIRLLDATGTVIESAMVADGGSYTFIGPFSAGTYIIELDTENGYEHIAPTIDDNSEIDITSGTTAGSTDGNAAYNITQIDAIREDTSGEVTVSYDGITDLAAWDRVTAQKEPGGGAVTYDIEVDDGTGWSVLASSVTMPFSIASVSAESDVRIVVSLSRPTTGDTTPQVPYVARRGER